MAGSYAYLKPTRVEQRRDRRLRRRSGSASPPSVPGRLYAPCRRPSCRAPGPCGSFGSKLTRRPSKSLPGSSEIDAERREQAVQHLRAQHRALVVDRREDHRPALAQQVARASRSARSRRGTRDRAAAARSGAARCRRSSGSSALRSTAGCGRRAWIPAPPPSGRTVRSAAIVSAAMRIGPSAVGGAAGCRRVVPGRGRRVRQRRRGRRGGSVHHRGARERPRVILGRLGLLIGEGVGAGDDQPHGARRSESARCRRPDRPRPGRRAWRPAAAR